MKEDVICQKIASNLNLTFSQVKNTLSLLGEGNTVHFIARYRKEATNSLNEVDIDAINNLNIKYIEFEKRRDFILQTIEQSGLLGDELKNKIESAETIEILEDLYLPFKPKKKTKASVAREKGLEPLAKIIMSQTTDNIFNIAQRYINKEKEIFTADDAINGASDIIAEWVNEHAYTRSQIRRLFNNEAIITAKVIDTNNELSFNYKSYFDYKEVAKKAPSHRILAVFRGENEKILRVSIRPDKDKAINIINRIFIKPNSSTESIISVAIKDAYSRLLEPSLENELKNCLKDKADESAIIVFADNLKQLLMQAPLHDKTVLAIDPGFRTGCKIVVIDSSGKLLNNVTIYPHPPENKIHDAISKITNLVEAYKVDAIAIGNGTAGRETESFIKRIHFSRKIIAVMVNENGASVYSASATAREEFPDYDITVRGAVSIGRRLIDPLAELVKIDPKSIGVGQYQHDVDQNKLKDSLKKVVEDCVNNVGVDVNTASKELLVNISGLGPAIAQNVIDYRNTIKLFSSREELNKIPRFGAKAFQQAAGFLRVRNSNNPLDNSTVHPESYYLVEKMAADLNCTISDLIGNKELIDKIEASKYVSQKVGLPTINDIIVELKKPGRDPRQQFDIFEFDENIKNISDLKAGMVIGGIITNITSFGAFVDIGIHQDGLIHISQITDKYISDPNEILKLNQKVMVKVLDADVNSKRISLSMKNI